MSSPPFPSLTSSLMYIVLQVEDYTRELRNKDMSLKAAAIELEEANTSYFTADSKVLKLEKELMLKSHENLEKFNYLESQVCLFVAEFSGLHLGILCSTKFDTKSIYNYFRNPYFRNP